MDLVLACEKISTDMTPGAQVWSELTSTKGKKQALLQVQIFLQQYFFKLKRIVFGMYDVFFFVAPKNVEGYE